jgi:hypothetical protein
MVNGASARGVPLLALDQERAIASDFRIRNATRSRTPQC